MEKIIFILVITHCTLVIHSYLRQTLFGHFILLLLHESCTPVSAEDFQVTT